MLVTWVYIFSHGAPGAIYKSWLSGLIQLLIVRFSGARHPKTASKAPFQKTFAIGNPERDMFLQYPGAAQKCGPYIPGIPYSLPVAMVLQRSVLLTYM